MEVGLPGKTGLSARYPVERAVKQEPEDAVTLFRSLAGRTVKEK